MVKSIKEIAEYIIEKYPGSCLAQNVTKYGHGYLLEDDEMLTEELASFFAYDLLGLCGCGNPEDAWDVIRRVLRIRSLCREREYDEIKQMYKDELRLDIDNDVDWGILQFILYILDDKGLVEHGSSIGGCWLTELGEMYLTVLDAWFELEAREEV
jgi:hypothetical protein